MGIESQIIVALTSYKLASLFVGSVFAYMGYRLFMAGVWGDAGDVEAQFQDNKLVVKRAAPGTFFALFGAIVISVTIFKGLQLKDNESSISKESTIEIIEEKSDELPKKLPF